MSTADTISPTAPQGCVSKPIVTVDDIIATDQLFARPSRPADYKAENEALAALVEVMSQSPAEVLQKLVDTALALCGAGSAGISIEEVDQGKEIFRWRATAGEYTKYLGGTMPRYFSPCGAVLERDAPILMINMVDYYGYVSELKGPPQEVLLVPFHSKGKAIGTMWVVAHDGSRQFDKEDLRILRSLTSFASVAVEAFSRTHELELAGQMREQFIAVLGHDLRNPLAAITNSATLLSRGTPTERVAPLGQMIGQSARRIGELVDNLLDFTRGRLGGGITVDRITHDTLEPTLKHITDELRVAYPDHLVVTRFRFDEPFRADAHRLGQMISNLLANAFTHGDPNQPIKIEGQSGNGILVLSVANGGRRIPEDVVSRLFEPYERGAKDGNREGLGLGLYIASEIAKGHGGELTVSSTDDETIFRFIMRS